MMPELEADAAPGAAEEPVDQPVDAVEQPVDAVEQPVEEPVDQAVEEPVEEPVEAVGAEAAKYRRRLRETEKERDAIAARVEALQRQQIETQLSRLGLAPAALWATTDLGALVREDGTVDADAVTAAVETARAELGITLAVAAAPPTLLDAFTPKRSR